jgi:hypothetical protein
MTGKVIELLSEAKESMFLGSYYPAVELIEEAVACLKAPTRRETPEQRKALMDEFLALCKPINDWLQKNYHPHARVIIENDHAEIVEGSMAVPFQVID